MIDTISSTHLDQEGSVATFIPSLPDKKFVTNKKLQIYKWIDKTLRIELTDGRVYEGILLCVDKQANIILVIKAQENIETTSSPLELDETLIKSKKQKKKNKKGGKQKEEQQSEANSDVFKSRRELSPMRKKGPPLLGFLVRVGMAMISRKHIVHIYLVNPPILND
ncbi:Sm domain-containing protein [Meloidogyne graminicola]|uniref:Sm domain-containing protein n=1 Tax=Meloidogyne graminicola TaxID=189291 RepID=A0A8S9Z781_9BILA|nr:Sm domain-containing protein [Meloidogyne graminicola]